MDLFDNDFALLFPRIPEHGHRNEFSCPETLSGPINLAILTVIGSGTMSSSMPPLIGLRLPKKLALFLAPKLLDDQITGANTDCMDAIGEIANKIVGITKSELHDMGASIPVQMVLFYSVKEPYKMVIRFCKKTNRALIPRSVRAYHFVFFSKRLTLPLTVEDNPETGT